MTRRTIWLAACVLAVHAASAVGASEVPPALDAQRVEAAMPGVKVRSLSPVPISGGLYEVIDEHGAVFYIDGAARIGFQAELFDVVSRRNLTEESLARYRAVDFDRLPLELAIKRVKGTGARRMAVFADPDCPYCAKLEATLVGVDDVTVYTFLYPLASVHPGASERAARIWCSPDPDAAWRAWVLHREPVPAGPACETPLARIAGLAPQFHVNGTPSLVFGSGRVAYGSLGASVLETYLNERALPPPAATSGATGPSR